MVDRITAPTLPRDHPVESPLPPPASPWLPAVRYSLLCMIVLRVILSAIGIWELSLRTPHVDALVRAQSLGQPLLPDIWLGPWQRFDAFWYMRLAQHGYGASDGSTVYFPLYPLLIKATSLILFPLQLFLSQEALALLAALLVSFVACGVLLIVLYLLTARDHGHSAARRTLLLLCVFPTASFLLGPYTESLYLALVVGCFLAARHRRVVLLGMLAGLAALTRLQGVVLVLPLLWIALDVWRAHRRLVQTLPWLLAAAAPLVGTLLFSLYTRLVVHGQNVATAYTQQIHQQLAPPWVTLQSYWLAVSAHQWHIFSYHTGNWVDVLNMGLAVLVLALILPNRPLLGTPLWLYALSTWIVTLCIYHSTDRYMLTVFPAFIVLAVRVPQRRACQLIVLLSAPLMLFVAGEFVQWSFVG